MGMSVGSGGPQKAEINMTPMIDVLLVLIIIFLLITPLETRGLDALIPQNAPDDGRREARRNDIVITVNGNHQVSLNQESMDVSALEKRLLTCSRPAPAMWSSCAETGTCNLPR